MRGEGETSVAVILEQERTVQRDKWLWNAVVVGVVVVSNSDAMSDEMEMVVSTVLSCVQWKM